MTILRHQGYSPRSRSRRKTPRPFSEVINAPGVITFYGEDVADLKAESHARSRSTRRSAGAHGSKLGKPLSGRFVLRMKPEQHARVSAAAALAGKSVNAWAIEALDHAAAEMLEE